ncbi:MAG: metallophosphoesterase [Candidatus Krumholzibacteriia bacterium]
MRLLLLSDVHLEFAGYTPTSDGYDAVVLAGDTSSGLDGIAWAAGSFGGRPVAYVPGNHEYYGDAYPRHLAALRRAAAGTCVHVLDRGVLDLGPVRILGCTLWTDFQLNGSPRVSRRFAVESMWDYREIRISPRLRHLEPRDTVRWHRRSRAWLAAELAGSAVATVVATHHAPSPRSVSAALADRPYSPAYASDLTPLLAAGGPALWVHGHTHRRQDYRIGATRVICNPRGYPGQDTGFDPGLILEL